jgi:hypothetical protein
LIFQQNRSILLVLIKRTNNFVRSSIEFNGHSILEIVRRDRSSADKEREMPAADLQVVEETRLKCSERIYLMDASIARKVNWHAL